MPRPAATRSSWCTAPRLGWASRSWRFATDGRFDQPAALAARKLLVLGDSVTRGANMERPNADRNAPYWWNARLYYGTLLREHPRAQVALTEGAILNGDKKAALTANLQETARRVDSPQVHVLPSHYHPGDARDAHPTTAQHARMAQELAPLLKSLMR